MFNIFGRGGKGTRNALNNKLFMFAMALQRLSSSHSTLTTEPWIS